MITPNTRRGFLFAGIGAVAALTAGMVSADAQGRGRGPDGMGPPGQRGFGPGFSPPGLYRGRGSDGMGPPGLRRRRGGWDGPGRGRRRGPPPGRGWRRWN